jgi:hypothetical protein
VLGATWKGASATVTIPLLILKIFTTQNIGTAVSNRPYVPGVYLLILISKEMHLSLSG